MLDTTISLGNILTILAFLVGGVGFLYTLKSNLSVMTTTTDLRLTQISAEIDDFKEDIKKLNEAIVAIAAQNMRITLIDERYAQRIAVIEDRITGSFKQMNETITATGHRVDELGSRLNRAVDAMVYGPTKEK